MAKIKVLDFAKNVEYNRNRLIKNIKHKGEYIPLDASLETAVSTSISLSNSIGEKTGHQVRWINIDGELVCPTVYVENGSSISVPSDPIYDEEYLEFAEWSQTGDITNVTTDIDCGAIYRTKQDSSGRRFSCLIIDITEMSGFTVNITATLSSTSTIIVDWGDSTSEEFINNTALSHTYTGVGRYVIKLWSDYTGFKFQVSEKEVLKKLYLGDNCGKVASFQSYTNLTVISIPPEGISISSEFMSGNYSLKGLILPQSCSGSLIGLCKSCYNVKAVVLSMNMSGGAIRDTFVSCYNLTHIILPRNITILGQMAFQRTSIEKIFIPNSVTEFDIATSGTSDSFAPFTGCANLKEIIFEDGTSPLTIEASTMRSLPAESLILPTRLVSLGAYSIYDWKSLKRLSIPPITTFASTAIQNNPVLEDLLLPKDFAFSINLTGCKSLSLESIANMATQLKDRAEETSLVITLPSHYSTILGNTYIDNLGNLLSDNFNMGTTIIQYIQNKNWTVSFA